MGQIKVVLIFNEDDERQREAGEYLKTKKRCKTALVTELVHAWMKNGETAVNTVSSAGNINIEDIKKQLLQDKDFLSRIEKSMTEIGNQNNLEAESEDNENLDILVFILSLIMITIASNITKIPNRSKRTGIQFVWIGLLIDMIFEVLLGTGATWIWLLLINHLYEFVYEREVS